MTAYPTHVISCDLCGHVFVEPTLKLASQTRQTAQLVGWKSVEVQTYQAHGYVHGGGRVRMRRQAHNIDICADCAATKEGVFPMVAPPIRLLDYLRSDHASLVREIRKRETDAKAKTEGGTTEGRNQTKGLAETEGAETEGSAVCSATGGNVTDKAQSKTDQQETGEADHRGQDRRLFDYLSTL